MIQDIILRSMQAKGYTIPELAAAAGVGRGTIQRLLSDNPQQLGVLTASKLEQALELEENLYWLSRSVNTDSKRDETERKATSAAI
jgi:transcriptional regulator with XRE-family HTH domain